MIQMNLFMKQKQTHRHRKKRLTDIEKNLRLQKGKGGEEINYELGLTYTHYHT